MKKFLCDFEPSLLKAVETEFPGLKKTQGCFFHFRQALKRNVGKRNLLSKLKEDRSFRKSFDCLSALAFVPENDVKMLFDKLIQQDFFHPDLKDYAKTYFLTTWIQGENGTRADYKLSDWNCFQRWELGKALFLARKFKSPICIFL